MLRDLLNRGRDRWILRPAEPTAKTARAAGRTRGRRHALDREPRGQFLRFRGDGFGRRDLPVRGGELQEQLLAEAEKTARTLWGCTRMKMTVISIRDELIMFYERRGYRRTGTEPFPFDREPGVRRKDFHFVVLSKTLA